MKKFLLALCLVGLVALWSSAENPIVSSTAVDLTGLNSGGTTGVLTNFADIHATVLHGDGSKLTGISASGGGNVFTASNNVFSVSGTNYFLGASRIGTNGSTMASTVYFPVAPKSLWINAPDDTAGYAPTILLSSPTENRQSIMFAGIGGRGCDIRMNGILFWGSTANWTVRNGSGAELINLPNSFGNPTTTCTFGNVSNPLSLPGTSVTIGTGNSTTTINSNLTVNGYSLNPTGQTIMGTNLTAVIDTNGRNPALVAIGAKGDGYACNAWFPATPGVVSGSGNEWRLVFGTAISASSSIVGDSSLSRYASTITLNTANNGLGISLSPNNTSQILCTDTAIRFGSTGSNFKRYYSVSTVTNFGVVAAGTRVEIPVAMTGALAGDAVKMRTPEALPFGLTMASSTVTNGILLLRCDNLTASDITNNTQLTYGACATGY